MARQLINIGTIENDGTGDKLRDAMDKINDNFSEVYTELGGDSLSNLDLSGNTISSANSNGDIILDPNGTGEVKVDNLAISGNTISSTDTNGNITLDPDGTGSVVIDSPVSITGALTLSTALSANVTGDLTGDVTGTVSSISNHDTDNLSEGSSNLYYTDARSRAALSATGSIAYNNSTGVISFTDAVTSVNGNTGAVVLSLSDIGVDGQLDGDLVGSVFGNDSTILVDGGANEVVGTINSTSGTITTLNATTIQGFTSLSGAGDAIITGGVFYGDETQVDRYLMKDSSIVIDETGTLLATINNSTTATFSGTVNLNGATVTNAAFDLTGDTTGTHYGFVDGDLIGSVFGDDSTLIIDGINKTGTLTELDVDDINIDGNTISAAGSPTNQNLILNVKGVAALQTNADTFILQPRTDYGVNGVGLAGDADNFISQDDDYLYKSAADYDGSTLIWKRAKLRSFDEPLFYVGADDSTMRGVNDLEGIKIIGGTNVTTSSDAEGNVTINASASGSYSWSIGADDSTLRAIGSGESVKIIGGTGITTSSDAEGNITINGHGIFGFSVGADDSTLREIGSGESFKIIGGTNVTTSSDSEGNITIDATDTGISNVVEDTTPQLGGELDAQSNNITNLGTLNTHTVPGGTGTLALTSDITFTASSTDTLTNKTISSASNTITITESNISDLGSYITASSSDTLTNKSIALGSNTVTGTVLNIGADDSTLRAVGVGEGIKIIGGTNVTTTSDAEGNITVNSSASGNVADDTTPQLGGDLDLNGHSITTARSNEDLNLTPNGTGTVTINGGLKLEEGTQEKFSSLTSATGTVTHDCSNGTIFYHTSISADFTANFTNLQLDSAYATTVSLVLVQGASEFIPTAVQVAGAAQTINWQGGIEPTGTDNGIDVVSFTILNNSGTYTVLAQLVDFT